MSSNALTVSASDRVYTIVRRVPRGRVASYGQVARLAGLGGHARLVGYALSRLPDESGVPWHRVIKANGEIAERADSYYEELQRELLQEEGVRFDLRGTVDMKRFRWSPETG